jgi:hypothetical protein
MCMRTSGNTAKPRTRGECMPSYESSMRNLAKARLKWRPPRPWRSEEESRAIRRQVIQWLTCCGTRPSAREWARQLGVSHTWVQKLIRRYQADPSAALREIRRCPNPTFGQLTLARAVTERMRVRGELRPPRRHFSGANTDLASRSR